MVLDSICDRGYIARRSLSVVMQNWLAIETAAAPLAVNPATRGDGIAQLSRQRPVICLNRQRCATICNTFKFWQIVKYSYSFLATVQFLRILYARYKEAFIMLQLEKKSTNFLLNLWSSRPMYVYVIIHERLVLFTQNLSAAYTVTCGHTVAKPEYLKRETCINSTPSKCSITKS